MLKKFLSQNRIYASLAFFFIIMSIYTTLSYTNNKEMITKSIDERLLSAAIASQAIMGDTLPDKAKNASSVSPQEDYQNILTLSKFAKASDVKYIYFMILDQNNTRFIVSSGTDEEIASGKKLTHYYDVYESKENILKAFQAKKVTFDPWVKDEWGTFRSVFVPYTTPNGTEYIIGVDIDLKLIETLSREAAQKEIMRVLLILLSLSPALYLLKLFRQDNTLLQQKIDEATSELKEINTLLQEKVADKTLELFEQFYNDTLTNLPNRNQLQEDIHSPEIIAIAIIDIDDFKEINDFFGTSAGDSVLIQFSQFLKAHRLTYRLSGDQFAFLFDRTYSLKAIKNILESILEKIEDEQFRQFKS